ncbi:MAG: glycosyltransferase [Candidatus Liptonbacteria bacterium]|nr:glycosyltransferase [Candidatus Liptonbacteria bacterium]
MNLKEVGRKNSNFVIHISSYPPRACGIATFTKDITAALDTKFNPAVKSRIVALNDNPTAIYNYPTKVADEINSNEISNYVNLAREINQNNEIKVVNLQHEFGLYGGNWGDYIIPFLQVIEKPVVTTFHTAIPDPEDDLKNIVRAIVDKSRAVIVMNSLSKDILKNDYGIDETKIRLVPHGIPQTAFESSEKYKIELGLESKTVLSTFGLLSPNKGIQYAIRALPEVIQKFPNVVYVVIGATHPNVAKEKGEVYRNSLIAEVQKLGLEEHVKFYNKYLDLEELSKYLKATDLYISPSIDEGQSVSGTLSYAMGFGRPVISTASSYAQFLVTPQTGVLVPIKNPGAITKSLLEILADEKRIKGMGREAYEHTRPMTWPNVATAYFNLYKEFADLEAEDDKLPDIKLDHLRRMTDSFGIFHFAKYSKPEKRYGYSLDDNARALVVSAKAYQTKPDPELERLMTTYLNFVKFTQRPNGKFANIVSYQKLRDATADEDVQGRAIWALGLVAKNENLPDEIRTKAEKILTKTFPFLPRLTSPRAIAFAMTGLYFYLKNNPKPALLKLMKKMADRQVGQYKEYSGVDWHWFEDQLTYSNSKLAESLFYAYDLIKNPEYLEVAKKTLNFLKSITFEKDHYSPIGQNGWYFRNKKRAYFDQQPEETSTMVETKVVAYQVTGDKQYLKDAYRVMNWFLGKNHLGQMVYDEATGGCYDGVGQYAINLNQGAESTISYLLARLALEEIKQS